MHDTDSPSTQRDIIVQPHISAKQDEYLDPIDTVFIGFKQYFSSNSFYSVKHW